MVGCTTPLLADTVYGERAEKQKSPFCHPRSLVHDQDFYRLQPTLSPSATTSYLPAYIPGTLSGLWEGILEVRHSGLGIHHLFNRVKYVCTIGFT